MNTYQKLLISSIVSALCAQPALAQERILPTVKVEEQAISAIVPTKQEVQESLNETPGGTNLIDVTENKGSKYTFRDILDYQPGVTLLDFFGGNDHPILTIRGSGIQSHPNSRGTMLLENGLPTNAADGSYFIGMLEPRDTGLISVRRGANAINPASDTLGGEIHFHSLTGRDETGAASFQVGSFGAGVIRAAIGRDLGDKDFHVSMSGSRTDGYRSHSKQERYAFRFNGGVKVSDNFENRTWFSYTDQKFDIPGPLSRDDVYGNPETNTNASGPMVSTTDPHRETRQFRIANRSLITTGDFSHDLGLYYSNTDDMFMSPTAKRDADMDTFGVQYKLDAQKGRVNYGLALSWAYSDMDITYNPNPKNPNAPIQAMQTHSYDATAQSFAAQLHGGWEFIDKWRLVGQLRWVHTKRDIEQTNGSQSHDAGWDWFAPKLGVIFNPTSESMFFANVSTAREAPTIEQMIRFRSPPPAPAGVELTRLEPQKYISYEIGGRGRFNRNYGWDVTLYHSDIKKELIEYSPDGISTYTFNHDGKTRHQGIELGLTSVWNVTDTGSLNGRLSYTLNNFKFRSGTYNGNRIPGIPKHLLSAELMYQTGPWQFGPNMRLAGGSTPVDHSNSQYYGGYALWGAKIFFEARQDLSFFLQGDNLTDKRYVASTSTPSASSDAGAHYFSGVGRSVTAGVSYKF